MPISKCKVCGKEFMANKSLKVICGTECQNVLARERYKSKNNLDKDVRKEYNISITSRA